MLTFQIAEIRDIRRTKYRHLPLKIFNLNYFRGNFRNTRQFFQENLPSLLLLSTAGSSGLISPCPAAAGTLFGFSTGILLLTHTLILPNN
jgi:hypothetical protein